MDDVVVARHGESETAARGVVGGDAPLTARGRAEAEALAAELAARPFDVCFTSRARRAVETAEVVLQGRDVRCEILPDLGDIGFGSYEGRALEEYREWVTAHAPEEPPPGGESRVATLRRFCRAYRALLARTEQHLLVVAHGLTLTALRDERPRPVVAGAAYASWLALSRDELAAAVARVEQWCEAPSW